MITYLILTKGLVIETFLVYIPYILHNHIFYVNYILYYLWLWRYLVYYVHTRDCLVYLVYRLLGLFGVHSLIEPSGPQSG